MKDSAYVGKSIETLQEQEELNQEQMAFDLNVSPSLVSHYKTGRRKMHREVAENALHTYSHNFEFALSLLHEFSDHITSPVLKGRKIERHRVIFENKARQEIEEALQIIDAVSLDEPPEIVTSNEKEKVKKVMMELLDAKTWIDNLLMVIEQDYEMSVAEVQEERLMAWKSWGWI